MVYIMSYVCFIISPNVIFLTIYCIVVGKYKFEPKYSSKKSIPQFVFFWLKLWICLWQTLADHLSMLTSHTRGYSSYFLFRMNDQYCGHSELWFSIPGPEHLLITIRITCIIISSFHVTLMLAYHFPFIYRQANHCILFTEDLYVVKHVGYMVDVQVQVLSGACRKVCVYQCVCW